MLRFMQAQNADHYTAKQFQILVITVATSAAALAFFEILPAVAIRYTVVAVLAAQITWEVYKNDRFALTSPLFLLASVAGLMFSVLPALGAFVLKKLSIDLSFAGAVRFNYLDQSAELYILAFSLFGLALHGVFCLRLPEQNMQQTFMFTEKSAKLLVATSLLLTVAALTSVYFGFGPNSIKDSLATGYPPLQMFIITFLIYQCLLHRTVSIGTLLAWAGIIIYFILTIHLKLLIFMSISIFLLLINKINYKYYIRIFSAFLIFILIAIAGLQIAKSTMPAFKDKQTPIWLTIVTMISHKIIWRQVDTGYCFQTVIEEHSNDKFEWSKQMFWARALIPRIVWPEKENLSLGSSYSVTYCDAKFKNAHSASITLLGQPFIMGGVRGFLLHGAFLFIGLSGLTYVSRKYPGVGRVFVIALLPWWIDFDQDFALYVAHLVKFFLLMCFIAVPVSVFGQSREYERNAA